MIPIFPYGQRFPFTPLKNDHFASKQLFGTNLPPVFTGGLKPVTGDRFGRQSDKKHVNRQDGRKYVSRQSGKEYVFHSADGRKQIIEIHTRSQSKLAYFKKAIASCMAQNFNLNGLIFESSSKANEKNGLGHACSGKPTAMYIRDVPSSPRIVFWRREKGNPFSLDDRLSLRDQLMQYTHPTWRKNIYTNSPIHLLYHEIGHHLYIEKLKRIFSSENWKFQQQLKAPRLTRAEQRLILLKMGNPHFAEPTGQEFVAELFAAQMGGKQLSSNLMRIYRKLNGPKLRRPPRLKRPL